jgi:hypothetical protein
MFVNIEGLDESVLQKARSGSTVLFVEGGEITADGTLIVPKGAQITLSKAPRRGPAEAEKLARVGMDQVGRRDLGSKAVERHVVLAVRVRSNDSVSAATTAVLSDKVFGTRGDTINLSERYATCSYGELNMVPYVGTTTTGVSIAEGTYEARINLNVRNMDEAVVREEAIRVLTTQLGNLASQFDHVMICLPAGTSGSWIGYGKTVITYSLLCFDRCYI